MLVFTRSECYCAVWDSQSTCKPCEVFPLKMNHLFQRIAGDLNPKMTTKSQKLEFRRLFARIFAKIAPVFLQK